MHIEHVTEEIKKAGIPEKLVYIGEMPMYDERYNLIKRQDGKMEVFFGEKGCKTNLQIFECEEKAIDAFLERLKKHISGPIPKDLPFLPVGSVVRCIGGKINVVIVARAVIAQDKNGNPVYFDYGAFFYPHGLVDGNMAYFQRDAIEEVLFIGYINDQEERIVQYLLKFAEENKDIPRGDKDSMMKTGNMN